MWLKNDVNNIYFVFFFCYRFANFIQGGSHLDDTEILAFETETNKQLILHDDNFTDDSDG